MAINDMLEILRKITRKDKAYSIFNDGWVDLRDSGRMI